MKCTLYCLLVCIGIFCSVAVGGIVGTVCEVEAPSYCNYMVVCNQHEEVAPWGDWPPCPWED